ncbi:ABC transporter substrate-binding protein [Streptomonospora salina]|uniref:ABC-type branched-subunit amino acid transport system substrate-binding protein n=1 Tax=Streptomonospora salina TaxID=104205 RepID=A0A841EL76_9ACTN|nr:ABC transporter substrate-binding protein [Streptomonospora salina]MBB6001070.1 ABC-type branched-subunit amino acid transport system substrate-binding protein [Streptomonospora salina]
MRSRIAPAAALMAAALLATSCGGAGETQDGAGADLDVAPGVTDDSITIGSHQPLTGPAAPGYIHISNGARAVFDHINDNGGINGRQIDYVVKDDAYDPARTIEVTRELVHDEEIFAMMSGLGTPTHSKVTDFLDDEGVPDLFVSSGALQWNQPEEYPLTYGFQVDYTKEAKIQGQYIAENMPDAKVGYLHQNDDVGRDSETGLEQYLGDQRVAVESYDSGNTDVGPQISALQDAGADVVVCSCIPAFSALAMLESASIGYEPQFVMSTIGADSATLQGLLSEFAADAGQDDLPAEEMLDGMIYTGYFPSVTMQDDPWVQLYSQIYDEYGEGDTPMTNTTIYGMLQATLMGKSLMEAGDDPTRQSLIDAVHEQDLTGPGLVPFAAIEDDHGGYSGAQVLQFRAGEAPETLQEARITDNAGGEITEPEFERPGPEEFAFHDE